MKKIICIAIVSLTLANCQKTQKLNPTTSTSTNTTTVSENLTNARTGGTDSKYRIFSRVRGSYGCSGTGGNCLPDVVVKPGISDYIVFKNLIATVSSGNNIAIRNYFEANRTVLSAYMPVAEIDYVIAGTDNVTNVVNPDGVSNFLIFTNELTTMLVLPVKL